MTDYENLRKALDHLERQWVNHQRAHERPELTPLDREALAESVIQRFETSYDVLWKTLKRHLIEALGIPDPKNSPKPVFRLAAENGLLPSPVEAWLTYADARTATAYDYSGAKAAACLVIVPGFLADAMTLYARLVERPLG